MPVRWAARGAVVLLAAAPLAGVSQAAVSAATIPTGTAPAVTDPYAPAYNHPYRKGAVPTRGALIHMRAWASHNTGKVSTANDLSYGGGIENIGVTTGAEKVYLVFYGSQWGTQGTDTNGDVTLSGDTSGEAPYLQQFFKGLGTNGELWSGVMTQYCQGVAFAATSCPASNTQHVAYPTGGGTLAGVWVDGNAASPSQASAFQLGTEAVAAASHFGNTTAASNRDAQYVILSPTGTHPDGFNTPSGGFCAWHDYTGDPYVGVPTPAFGDIAFTNMPYVTDAGMACGADFVNTTTGADDGISIVAGHEYAETITDQNPAGGWTDPSGYENGDKCAWITPGTSGGSFDLKLGTGTFAMQTTWANDGAGGAGTCEASHAVVHNGSGNVVKVTNPGTRSTKVHTKVSLQIHATDSASGQKLSYKATGLPTGLKISATTGKITGTPTRKATFKVKVTATDTTGASGSAAFSWTIHK